MHVLFSVMGQDGIGSISANVGCYLCLSCFISFLFLFTFFFFGHFKRNKYNYTLVIFWVLQ